MDKTRLELTTPSYMESGCTSCTSCTHPTEADFDPRGTCAGCANLADRQGEELFHVEAAERLERLGHNIVKPGDTVIRSGKWVKLIYPEKYCKVSGGMPFPLDLPHRCAGFAPAGRATTQPAEEKEWWE